MKPLAALANASWLAASLPAWQRYRRALHDPQATQERILRGQLARHASSAYGRAHGMEKIRSSQEFRAQVPVSTFSTLEPWMRRLMKGEHGVLTNDPITRLVPTSGSTGARKLIPFTAGLQREFNAAISPWMVDLCRQHPSVTLGPAYWSISPAIPVSEQESSAVPVGFDDDSAYLGGLRQRLAEATFAVPSTLRLVSNLECARYLTLLCLLRQPDLRLISVWHPSFLTLLLDCLPRFWEELLKDLAQGGCPRAAALPELVRRNVHQAPQPRRAAALRQCGPADLHALWPHLRIASCWGDAQAALPLADLRRRLPHVILQPKGLCATEGFITIPFCGFHPIAICSHFYEFADAHGTLHQAHELRRGETYRVVITTGGGLWRYQMDDQVEVDGFVDATPSLRFLGRGHKVSDLCGEKLHENFVTAAIAAACASQGIAPAFAMLAPETSTSTAPHYTLFIEGSVSPDLVTRLEDELRENPHYALCRDLGQLNPLRVCAVQRAYEILCQAGADSGRRVGDLKPEALSQRTDWRTLFSR